MAVCIPTDLLTLHEEYICLPDVQVLEDFWIKVVYLSRDIQNVCDPTQGGDTILFRPS